MNHCIIFDLDGTLVDSLDDLTSAINYMRNEYGLTELDRETVRSYVGDGVKMLVRRSIQDSICDFDGALEKMSSYYREHIVDYTRCFPGVKSGLAELASNGFVLGVWTNKNEQPARHILSKLDISKYFDFVITDIDILIASSIALLNEKGYTTEASCAEHYHSFLHFH